MENGKLRIIKGWMQLLIGLIAIWVFIFVVTPLLTSTGKSAEMVDYIKENNIDATPLFYTESEVATEAVQQIRIE